MFYWIFYSLPITKTFKISILPLKYSNSFIFSFVSCRNRTYSACTKLHFYWRVSPLTVHVLNHLPIGSLICPIVTQSICPTLISQFTNRTQRPQLHFFPNLHHTRNFHFATFFLQSLASTCLIC